MEIDKSFDEDRFAELEQAEIEKGAVPVLIEVDNCYTEFHPSKYFICARTIRINTPPNGSEMPAWVSRLKYDNKFCLFTSETSYDRANSLEQDFFKNHLDKTIKRRQMVAFITHVVDKKSDLKNDQTDTVDRKRKHSDETNTAISKKRKSDLEYNKYDSRGYYHFKFARCPRAI